MHLNVAFDCVSVKCRNICRMLLSLRERRWDPCSIHIAVVSKHFLRSNSSFKSSFLPSSIVLENTWLNWLVSNTCICVCINIFAASRFYETKSSWLVPRNLSSSGLGNESATWNTALASISCIQGTRLSKPWFYTLSLLYSNWFFTVPLTFFSDAASCRYATLLEAWETH